MLVGQQYLTGLDSDNAELDHARLIRNLNVAAESQCQCPPDQANHCSRCCVLAALRLDFAILLDWSTK